MSVKDESVKTITGFWSYLMTDCILFGMLFATYVVLRKETFGGPSARDLFSLPFALSETLLLLGSTVTWGIAMIGASRGRKGVLYFWFLLAFLFGLSFVVLEVKEFAHFFAMGETWKRSAFLTAYFTLVGTHGLHVSVGLLWMVIMMLQVGYHGFTVFTFRRLVCFSLFWHFLDVVWIFIFTVVYLWGVGG